MSDKLKFGKYKGYSLEEIFDEGDEGVGYLQWLRDNTETTGKYAKQNKKLIADIDDVLAQDGGSQPEERPATRPAREPQKATSPNAAVDLLKKILMSLQNLEKIIANPGKVNVASTELEPDETTPF